MTDSKAYEPYYSNSQSLTEVLIDLKNTIATIPAYPGLANFNAIAQTAISQGQALLMNSAGEVKPATMNSLLVEDATVIGFALNSASTGNQVDVLIAGLLPTSGLSAGQTYYLSNNGSITTIPPSGVNEYVTRVGEAISSGQLAVQIEPPILVNPSTPPGQVEFTTPGTYTWVAPSDVTSVSVVCIGGGGGGGNWDNGVQGGSGGGLGWKNNIAVIPGNSYSVQVGSGGLGGGRDSNGLDGLDSYFIDITTVAGLGGSGGKQSIPLLTGGSFVGDGGGDGGSAYYFSGGGSSGGGGAGGYSGNGGNGARADAFISPAFAATAGNGGAGGGGGGGSTSANNGAGGGGGVDIYGEGVSGSAGISGPYIGTGGGGGSGGAAGITGKSINTDGVNIGGSGGLFGGGGGNSEISGNGGSGGVRIIWPGTLRQFPSTRTADE